MGIGHATKKGCIYGVKFFRALMLACAIALLATATCFASTVTLQWNANTETDLAGYRVYYRADSSAVPFAGTGATQGASPIDVAKNTTATISGLDSGHANFFAVTAYNTAGVESPYSNVVTISELTPPTASITYPSNNATVSGTVSVTASASDNVGVTRLEFYVNGVLQATDTSTPYLYSWNTATLAAGTYAISCKAYDAAGNVGTSGNVSTTVVNDTIAPAVSLTAPVNNATVSGTVTITANASDNVGVVKVEFYQDGALLSAGNVTPYSYTWNTSTVANGSHTLSTKAYDATGNVGQSANVTVTVNNSVSDTTAPTVSLAAPANNATVVGIVAVSINASDNVGVSKVEFYVNGALQATDTVAPYSFSWNTTALANASYTLSAKAYDAAGNVGQSGNVTVAGNNAVTPPPGTYTAVFGNATGANYPNTIQDTFINLDNVVNVASAILSSYTWPANTPANAILMQWDLSGLPASAKIQSATLNLYMSDAGGDSSYQIPVSDVKNKMPIISKCNGNTYDGLNAWTASSVPYNSIPLAQSDIGLSVDAPLIDQINGYKSWNVTNIITDWMAYPANNKGLLLNSSNKASSDSYRTFASSKAVDVNQRPKLVVTYTLQSDSTAPTVSIASPASSTTLGGTVSVTANASDNVGVTKVEFYLNGALQTSATAAPYSFSWNTATITNGSYTLSAKAYDAAGNVGQSANVVVTVFNDAVAPTVSITSPASSSTVSGTVSVTVNASDNVGVTKVEFYLNGALQATDTVAPYSFSWNVATIANGSYTLSAKAYDATGNVGQSANLVVTVLNDSVAPTVSIASPATSSTVGGTVSVTVNASDNVGVTKVEFYLNGALQATDAAAPYSFSWNTTVFANASYALSAKAYDAAGNVGRSGNVTVAINNAVTSPSGTYTAVFGNATGTDYPNTIQDTYLNVNSDVNAASTVLSSYTWPANTPANAILMQWDLSGLPASAKIQSATLNLYMSDAGGDSSYQVPVSELINKIPIISKCNGNTYDGLNAWTASSVPFNSIPLAQSDIGPAVDAQLIDLTFGYKSWNVTSIITDWIAYPVNNKGLLLNASNKASSDSYRIFASSEAVDANQRPKLVVTYTLQPDSTVPAVSAFTMPAIATALTVLVTTLAAADNVGVTGYLITGSSTAPAASATGWSATAPTSFTFAGSGSRTAYAWAKDASGNISASRSASVVITLPDTTLPTITVVSPLAGATVGASVTVTASATDNIAVTKMQLYIDNVLKTTKYAKSLSWTWNTRSSAKGAHVIKVNAYDAANNMGSKSLTVYK